MMYFLQLIRWKNLCIIVVTQLFVYVFLSSDQCLNLHISTDLILVCASTLLLAAAGYMINDYSDVRIDAVNKPEKLIVGRHISRRVVFALHLALNLVAVVLALRLNHVFAIINIAIAFILWQYSVRFKYYFFVGNVLIAGLMAMSLLVVDFSGDTILLLWLIYYTVFAFLTGLIREIIKDIEDQEGDARFGAKTLPNVLGIPKTKIVIYYLMLITLSLLIFSCAYLFYKDYLVLPLYLMLTTAVPLAVFFQKTISADSKKDFGRLSSMIKLIMLAGVLSMGLRCLTF